MKRPWPRVLVLLALLLLLALGGCGTTRPGPSGTAPSPSADAGSSTQTVDAGPSALNVLFIGNSYTYVNDLPGMLSQIAATAGTPPTIKTAEVVQGGATLEV